MSSLHGNANTLLPESWTAMVEGVGYTVESSSEDENRRSGILKLMSASEDDIFVRLAFSRSE